jgi:uncharacterized protein YjbI with pentapeptide repeats
LTGARIFISYKRGHAESEALRAALQQKLTERGYQVLVDETIQAGDRWSKELYDWLLECAGAVVLASPEAKTSDWCQREWHVLAARAQASHPEGRGVRVVPVCIGLEPADLGPLQDLQSIRGPSAGVPAVIEALGDIAPWRITARDYLALHSAWNRYQFESEPVLGQEAFSLEQVYVETECGVLRWEDIGAGRSGAIDPFDENNGGRVPLVPAVVALIEDPAFREAIVVQGPAGAGKSAFTLRLAKELESHGLHTVRIRFRDMRLGVGYGVEKMLSDAVRIGPESEMPRVPAESLVDEDRLRETVKIGDAQICKWVFVLDGWDEVSIAGSAGYKAQLQTWLPRIQEFFRPAGAPVRLVVTGRPSVELTDSRFLNEKTPVLTLRPIRPDQLRELAGKLHRYAKWSDLSRYEALLKAYEKWFGGDGKAGVEMLGLPLLAFLAFKTLSGWKENAEALVSSPSALYSALIDQTVAHSGKAGSESLRNAVHRGGADLRRLLQRTAAMISVGPSESISFNELKVRLQDDADLAKWVSRATDEDSLYALVVNFYFKGGHHDLGCEFLHKSFREYLLAECVVAELIDLAEPHQGPLRPPTREPSRDFEPGNLWFRTSRAIARLLGSSYFSGEVRDHLFWLIQRDFALNPRRWVYLRDLLADVYTWWADGAHLRLQPAQQPSQAKWAAPYVIELAQWVVPATHDEVQPHRTVSIDGILGFALIQLTGWVHSVARDQVEWCGVERRHQRRTPEGQTRFCPGDGHLHHVLGRWQALVLPSNSRLILPDIWAESERLGAVDLSNANLARANFSGARFTGVHLDSANLSEVNFSGALFDATDLSHTDLSNANMTGATFFATRLDGALLISANLHDTTFLNSSGDGAGFSLAILSESRLSGSRFVRAIFGRASLENARVLDTDLRHADLTGVKAYRAVFQDVITSGAIMDDSLRKKIGAE